MYSDRNDYTENHDGEFCNMFGCIIQNPEIKSHSEHVYLSFLFYSYQTGQRLRLLLRGYPSWRVRPNSSRWMRKSLHDVNSFSLQCVGYHLTHGQSSCECRRRPLSRNMCTVAEPTESSLESWLLEDPVFNRFFEFNSTKVPV